MDSVPRHQHYWREAAALAQHSMVQAWTGHRRPREGRGALWLLPVTPRPAALKDI